MEYVGGLHLFKECCEESCIIQFSCSLPVEVNIKVAVKQPSQQFNYCQQVAVLWKILLQQVITL